MPKHRYRDYSHHLPSTYPITTHLLTVHRATGPSSILYHRKQETALSQDDVVEDTVNKEMVKKEEDHADEKEPNVEKVASIHHCSGGAPLARDAAARLGVLEG